MNNKEKLIDEISYIILNNVQITDEWGGSKIVSWQWGNHLCIDGYDIAADKISKLFESMQFEIARLTSENAELREANRWVSVEERKPEDDGLYQVLKWNRTRRYYYISYCRYYEFSSEWELYSNELIAWRENLPLPSMPAEEE